jgi:predicted metal-dependent phosphoesterase TrpH
MARTRGNRLWDPDRSPADPATPDHLEDPSWKRADLHCHSRFSVFKYFRRANTRDSYNEPEDVYRIAKEQGMSYVTLSDHDSIDGALYLLNRYPDLDDFFISEEVETYFPETRQRVHLGVYGLNEEQHREIQRLRPDIRELIPYLEQENLVFAVNHLLQNYRMKNVASKYIAEMIEMCDVFEVLNGAMASSNNKVVYRLVASLREEGRRISMVGGSDAHTLKHVGKVYTVSRAESIPEFIENVRQGDCFAWGQEMRFTDLVTDIYALILSYYGQKRTDSESLQCSSSDKTIQLLGRLAAIPTAMSGIPAAITTLNYLKQILVSQGINWKLPELVNAIRRSDQNENERPPTSRV